MKLNFDNIFDEYCSYKKNKDIIIKKKKINSSNYKNFNKVNLNVKDDLFFYYLYRVIGDKFLLKNIFNETDLSKTIYKTKLNSYNNFRNLVNFKLKSGQHFVINNPKVEKIFITINNKNNDFIAVRDFGDGTFIYQSNKDIEINQIYFHTNNDLINYSYLILNNNEEFIVNNSVFQLIKCKNAIKFDAEILFEKSFYESFSKNELQLTFSNSSYKDIFNKVIFNNSSGFQLLKSKVNNNFRIKLSEKTKFTNYMYDTLTQHNFQNLLLIND